VAAALSRFLLATWLVAAMPAPAAPTIAAGVEKWRAGAYPEAVAIWAPFAAAGDADAMFNMGQAYKLGRGVTADAAQARDYYRKAATKGHLPAQANLGITLFQGGDKVEAVRWLRLAADRGDARAQYVLGFAAFNGDGVTRAPGLGYGYLLRSAALGLPQAQTALGSLEPALSATDRAIGESVAASLATGKGLPAGQGLSASPRPAVAATPLTPMLPQARATPPLAPATRSAGAAAVAPTVATVVLPSAARSVSPMQYATPPAVSVAAPLRTPPIAAPLPNPSPAATATTPAAGPAADARRPDAAVIGDAKPTPPAWRVQLGAYAARSKADEAWAMLRAAVDAGTKPIFAGDGSVTRLQIGPYPSRDAAKAACTKLAEAGRACFVVAG